MRTVNIFKAQPFTKNGEIDSVTILIDRTLPEVGVADLNEWKQVARKEAITLCDALCDSLPQGVVDSLLVELLDRKRSLLVIPGWAPASQEEPKICLTKGCENRSDQGQFIGDLCMPCHQAITSGVVGHGNGFIGVLYRDNKALVQYEDKLRTALIKIGQAVTDPSRCGELTVGWVKRKVAEALAPAPLREQPLYVRVHTAALPLREQILDGKQKARLQELESSLRAVYDGFSASPGLHLIPFEEWLMKRAIDGDQEADELLALRQVAKP